MYIFGCAPREKPRCPRLTIAISELNRFVTSPFSLSLSFILLSATVGKSDSFFFFFSNSSPDLLEYRMESEIRFFGTPFLCAVESYFQGRSELKCRENCARVRTMEGFVLIEITISRVHSQRMIYLSLSFSFLFLPIQKNSFPLLPQFLTFLLPNHPSSSSSTDICPISIQQFDADRSSFESQSVERVKLINETRAVIRTRERN